MPVGVYNTEDTSKNIWELKFLCRYPDLHTKSEEYLKLFGTPTTFDKGVDQELANQWITSYITIDQMTEFNKKDIPIKVVNHDDVKKIYDYISLHLHAWKKQLSNGINLGDAPIDDLIELDKFANVVYEHARYQFTNETVQSFLSQEMSTVMPINRHNFFKAGTVTTDDSKITRINAEEEDNLPKRETLADLFKNRRVSPKKWSQ